MPVRSIKELLAWEPPVRYDDVIGGGVLPSQTKLVLFGPPKSWKSQTTLYTAWRLSLGESWFGFPTAKCVVLIYQAELPELTMQKRVAKFSRNEQINYPDVFCNTATYSAEAKLDTAFGMSSLDKAISDVKRRIPELPMVLILDPFYKLMSGHISDPKDTQQLLDNLDDMIQRHSVSIIAVHHTRLTHRDAEGRVIDSGSEDAMGSSYIGNWCDTMMKLTLLDPQPKGLGVQVGAAFHLGRNAEEALPSFVMQWDRATLHPLLLSKNIESDGDGGAPKILR